MNEYLWRGIPDNEKLNGSEHSKIRHAQGSTSVAGGGTHFVIGTGRIGGAEARKVASCSLKNGADLRRPTAFERRAKDMATSNGDITYEACIGGSKTVVKTVRGRITPKLVKTASRTWDRNGRRVSRYHPAQMVIRLISYKIDGCEEVQIGKRYNVEPTCTNPENEINHA